MVWTLFLFFWGQDWNKREVIYSSLIGTTLPLLPYLSASVSKEWFHDFCPSTSQETDVGLATAGFCLRSKTRQTIGLMTFCLPANMFFCGFMECLSPFETPATRVESTSLLMVSGSRIRSDVQDLLGALFFLTVTFLSALERVIWNGNHPVKKLTKNLFFKKNLICL